MYLSIDFEDYYHDLKRGLGLCESGPIKSKQLWEKYENINNFLDKNGEEKGKYATFFCTGILAKKEPNLIKQIAQDGHEIACHYFYHDIMKNDSDETVYKRLSEAKEYLEKFSNTSVKGFRAPYFLIDKEQKTQYKIVEKVFEYDSSFHCNNLKDLDRFIKKMNLDKLKIIPLYSSKMFGKSLRLGGTYLKLFPLIYSQIMLKNNQKSGLVSQVYMHPYEFDVATNFKVKYHELLPLGMVKALYWSFRQNQWLLFNNSSSKIKLKKLIQNSKLEGKLENLLFQ
tara:strand:+ start:1170 stop:2018 length:849 start_codon:yes stop_codon:yes gene_type:complete